MLASLMDSVETIIHVHHVFRTIYQMGAKITEHGPKELPESHAKHICSTTRNKDITLFKGL
jgi:hypothetical protein